MCLSSRRAWLPMLCHIVFSGRALCLVFVPTLLASSTLQQEASQVVCCEFCRWLVALSFRVVFYRDPIPANRAKANPLAEDLVHVHGEIYIERNTVNPAEGQPWLNCSLNSNAADHSWTVYRTVRHALVHSATHTQAHKSPGHGSACASDVHAQSAPCNRPRGWWLRNACTGTHHTLRSLSVFLPAALC